MAPSRRTLLAAAAGCAAPPAVFGPAGARAQGAGAPTRWQCASAYPDGTFHTRNLRAMIEEVQAATGGALQVQLHSNASLLPQQQIKRGVQTGQVQLGEILLSAYGNEDPFFEVDSLPQLVATTEQARRLHELSKPPIEARFARQGLVLLYMVPWPPSWLYTNQAVPTLEALRGTRMRTFNVMTNRFATLVGASPTLVQAAEIPQAFTTGVVTVMVTSAQTGVDSQPGTSPGSSRRSASPAPAAPSSPSAARWRRCRRRSSGRCGTPRRVRRRAAGRCRTRRRSSSRRCSAIGACRCCSRRRSSSPASPPSAGAWPRNGPAGLGRTGGG
jgi:hypothetical protein